VEYSPLYFILLLHALWPWLGAFSQERLELWLPKDDLRDSSSWSSSPFILLFDIHSQGYYPVRLERGLYVVSVTGQRRDWS
jgi:hypothetical protein